MATKNFFSHTGSDGTNAGQRANDAGYYWYTWGENIAAGYPTAQAVMNAWMNSPGHRANVLNPNFRDIGIAAFFQADSRYGLYWTQVFAARTGGGSTPAPSPAPAPAMPLLSSLSPTRGAAGARVTLTGRRFGARAGRITFSGAEAAVLSWSDTRIQVVVPNGVATGPVQVHAGPGDSNVRTFTVIQPAATARPTTPRLALLTPPRGPSGTTVTLVGQNLGAAQGTILFSGTVTIESWSDTAVTVMLKAPRPARRPVRVRRADGRTSNALMFDLR
jgi:hypothetical protein